MRQDTRHDTRHDARRDRRHKTRHSDTEHNTRQQARRQKTTKHHTTTRRQNSTQHICEPGSLALFRCETPERIKTVSSYQSPANNTARLGSHTCVTCYRNFRAGADRADSRRRLFARTPPPPLTATIQATNLLPRVWENLCSRPRLAA